MKITMRAITYISTPFNCTLSNDELSISSARVFNSSTSQFAQTSLFLKNAASSDATHTRKCAGNSTILSVSIYIRLAILIDTTPLKLASSAH